MHPFGYPGHPVREDIVAAHREVWRCLPLAGHCWTGSQRVAMATALRFARTRRNDPPWLRSEWPVAAGDLPQVAVDIVRRVALDAHQIDREWCAQQIVALQAALSVTAQADAEAAYVELVAVCSCVTAIDAMAEALGVPLEDLPEPSAGEPDGHRAESLGDGGAFVEMTSPFVGPNVARALSQAPRDHGLFMLLVGSMYALKDFITLVWDRPLDRPQVELLASRVSAINECFY